MTSEARGSEAPRDGGASEESGVDRALATLAAGGVASFVVAAGDAHYAWHAAPVPPASRLQLLVVDAGLVAPLTVSASALVAAGLSVLWPWPLPTQSRITGWLFAADGTREREQGGAVAGSLFFGFLALVVTAHAARRLLVADAPAPAQGAAMASAALAAAFVTVLLARETARVRFGLSPFALVGTSLVATMGLLAYGVSHGTPNGDGGFFGILGVLAREELDLRGPALLCAAVGLSALAPLVARRATLRAALASVLAALLSTAYAAKSPALESRPVSLAIERGAPLGGRALALLRRLSDRDHDGVSALFGGGDCNDHDAAIYPGADDVPGNGKDEDCSGADDTAAPRPAIPKGPSAGQGTGRLPSGLSVILITVDTLRADLGFMGNPRPVSPNLDGLALRSTVFERAYSLASYTGKSMGPLLLGKYPSETHRTFAHFDRFAADETFVQERLQRAGIHTLTAQGHWYFKPDTGLGRGFDVFDFSASPRVPQAEGDRTVNGDKLTDAAIALLSKPENVSRRFYFWMHYIDPHAEYVPHPEHDFGKKGRDLYDGEVAFTDRQVGRLLSFLHDSGLEAHTAIVVTSDHGEAFGEHGMVRHGFEVWEELVRVPLIVFVPGIPAHRVKEPRSAIDLVPTLLDLFGAPAPTGRGADFVSGQSLAPDLLLGREGHAEPRPVFVDMSEGPYNDERQALIEGSMKLIAARGRPIGLYDLDKDPGERRDLLGDDAVAGPVVARYRAYRRALRTVAATR